MPNLKLREILAANKLHSRNTGGNVSFWRFSYFDSLFDSKLTLFNPIYNDCYLGPYLSTNIAVDLHNNDRVTIVRCFPLGAWKLMINNAELYVYKSEYR